MKGVIALCKTFHGEEFLDAMIESVYHNVEAIVFVHSDTSWTGDKGNTVIEPVERWRLKNDDGEKIHQIFSSENNQQKQYSEGWKYINKTFPQHNFKMLIDTDEVWARLDLENAFAIIDQNDNADAFSCHMSTYLKSPFFQIQPLDSCCPVVFVRSACPYLGIRGSGITSTYLMAGVKFHHFSGVRKNLDALLRKIRNSSHVEGVSVVPEQEWVEGIWNPLPVGEDLHWCMDFRPTWKRVEKVSLSDLPEACRDKPFVLAFDGHEFHTKEYEIRQKSIALEKCKEYNLPKGFGPGHPDWGTPSKMAKYKLMMRSGNAPPTPVATEDKKKDVPVIVLPPTLSSPNEPVEKLPPSKRNKMYGAVPNPGKMRIVTMVSGVYQWYAPLFVDRIRAEYPEYDVLVLLRGGRELPDDLMDGVQEVKSIDYKGDGYTTAALRYVWDYPGLSKYDYCLISDVDMLHYREDPPIVDQRMLDLRVNNLKCYSNYRSSIYEGKPRLPGIHFITRDWWDETKTARKRHKAILKKNGASCWAHDEVMIGEIVKESGLPIQDKDLKLWQMHGLHLGDIRRQVEGKKRNTKQFGGADSLYIQKLLNDNQFMDKVVLCAEHIPTLRQSFDFYKQQMM